MVFGLTRPGIEPESSASVADALSTDRLSSIHSTTVCLRDHIKSNLSLYLLYYVEACNELAGPISASLRSGNTTPFEEMSQRWQEVGNNVSDLTCPKFEPETFRSKDELVTVRNELLP